MVIPQSIREYGVIVEIRKDIYVNGIFEQRDHFFTCAAKAKSDQYELNEGEKAAGYELRFVSLDEAIFVNETEIRTGHGYSERETRTQTTKSEISRGQTVRSAL